MAIIAGLGLATTSANAADESDIAACAAISGGGERLICYDELASNLDVDEPELTSEDAEGNWSVRTEVSPVDDSKNVFLSVESNTPISSRYGRQSFPSLVVRCKENTTTAYIVWREYLGLNTTEVLTRLDKETARTNTWSLSTDRKATFVRGSDIRFIKSLFDHDKLLAQVTPYGENPVMATFPINGLTKSITPLREACHW